MAYLIKYDDIRLARDQSAKQFNNTLEGISKVKDSITKLLDCQNFSGQSAVCVKNYMNEVHALLLSAISVCISTYSKKLMLYCDNYYSIESNKNAIISHDTLEHLIKEYGTSISKFEVASTNLGNKIKAIYDIFPIQNPSVAKVIDDIHEMKANVEAYKNDVDEYERVNKELGDLENLIISLRNSIFQYKNITSREVMTYRTGDIINNKNNIELINNILAANKFSKDNVEVIKNAQEHQQEIYDELESDYQKIQSTYGTTCDTVFDTSQVKCISTNMCSATPIVATDNVTDTGSILSLQVCTDCVATSTVQALALRSGSVILGKELVGLGVDKGIEYIGEQLILSEGEEFISSLISGLATGKILNN